MRQFKFLMKCSSSRYNNLTGDIIAKTEKEALKRLTALGKKLQSISLVEVRKEVFELDQFAYSPAWKSTTPVQELKSLPKRK